MKRILAVVLMVLACGVFVGSAQAGFLDYWNPKYVPKLENAFFTTEKDNYYIVVLPHDDMLVWIVQDVNSKPCGGGHPSTAGKRCYDPAYMYYYHPKAKLIVRTRYSLKVDLSQRIPIAVDTGKWPWFYCFAIPTTKAAGQLNELYQAKKVDDDMLADKDSIINRLILQTPEDKVWKYAPPDPEYVKKWNIAGFDPNAWPLTHPTLTRWPWALKNVMPYGREPYQQYEWIDFYKKFKALEDVPTDPQTIHLR